MFAQASASAVCRAVPVGTDAHDTCHQNAEDLCPVCSGELRLEVLGEGQARPTEHPFFRVSVYAARTLNAIGPSRVTLSLR